MSKNIHLWLDTGLPDTVLVVGHSRHAISPTATPPNTRPPHTRRADGRALMALAEARLGLAPAPIDSAASGLPLWPDDRQGSFSHWQSQSLCLLARTKTHSYGADIEGLVDPATAADIRTETMTKTEQGRMGDLVPGLAETLIFSAKESFFKAAFPQVGRIFGFDALELASPPAKGQLHFAITQDLAPDLPRGRPVDLSYALLDGAVVTWLALPVPPTALHESVR